MISVHFQGKPFNITLIQVYTPTSNAEEAEVEQSYEGQQDLLKLTSKQDVLFIIGDWNAKVGSQEIDGETVETVSDFIFWSSKITADGDCSHEIKRRFLLGRKAVTNLDSILKSRDITFPTNVHLVKAMIFPAVMYGCEVWILKKAEW